MFNDDLKYRRVHITQSTLDYLRQEYEVEAGMGHLRNQYLRYENLNFIDRGSMQHEDFYFLKSILITFSEKTTSAPISSFLHQTEENHIFLTHLMFGTTCLLEVR